MVTRSRRRFGTFAVALLVAAGVTASVMPLPAAQAVSVTVVHGREGRPGEFGSLVMLADRALWEQSGTLDEAHFCGGTLVAPRLVVTAAHCVEAETPRGLVVGVVAGGDRTDPQPVVRTVESISVHPDYSRQTLNNDIAVVHLSAPIRGVPTTPPARAQDAERFRAGAAVRAAGWGRLSTSGAEPRFFQVAELVAFPDTSCGGGTEPYTVGSLTFEPWSSDDVRPQFMLCAAGVRASDNEIIDTCIGDSGGPLLGGTGAATRLVGIVSWGPRTCAEVDHGAAGRPGVYTRVATYTDFLRGEGVPFPQAASARPSIASVDVIDRRAIFVVRHVNSAGSPPVRAVVRCTADGQQQRSGAISERRRAVVLGLVPGVRYECRAIVVRDVGRATSPALVVRLPRR